MANAKSKDWKKASSIYDFTVKDIDGHDVSLEKYRGHVCLIVNVACKWGLTGKNYEQLQALYDEYAESKGLRILAFPCNQFGGQEPGTNEEIKATVTEKYGVKFDMFAKIEVNGSGADPLWCYLKSKKGGTLGDFIKWNFSKFLINKEGIPVQRYAPTVEPFAMKKDIEKLF